MPLPEIEIIEQVEVPELLQVTVEVQELLAVLMEYLLRPEAAEATIEVVHLHPELIVQDEVQEAINQEALLLAETIIDPQADPALGATVAVVPQEAVDQVGAIEVLEVVPGVVLE